MKPRFKIYQLAETVTVPPLSAQEQFILQNEAEGLVVPQPFPMIRF